MGDVPEQAKTVYRRMPLALWHPAEPGRPDSRPPVREIRFFIVRKNSKSLMTEAAQTLLRSSLNKQLSDIAEEQFRPSVPEYVYAILLK